MAQFIPLAVTIYACASELDHCMVHLQYICKLDPTFGNA